MAYPYSLGTAVRVVEAAMAYEGACQEMVAAMRGGGGWSFEQHARNANDQAHLELLAAVGDHRAELALPKGSPRP